MYGKLCIAFLILQTVNYVHGGTCIESTLTPDVYCLGINSTDELKNELKDLNKNQTYSRLSIDGSNFDILSIDPATIAGTHNFSKIFVRYSNITTIPSNAFNSSTLLDQVHIDHCQIGHIESDAFVGLKNLLWFSLTECHLKQLPENLLNHLDSVQYLQLSGNGLESVRATDFSHHSYYLDLSKNNLKNLASNAFGNLTDLAILYLNHNEISEVAADAFHGLSALHFLELRNNSIESLPKDVFSNNPKLNCVKLDEDVEDPVNSDPDCTIFSLF